MNRKIKRFIPSIAIEKWITIQIFLHRKECFSFPKSNNKKQAVIIGNGPSLNETIEEGIDKLLRNDCFMVNQSVESPLFKKIKPKYYVLADPNYFFGEDLCPNARKFIENIENNLNWNLTLFIPKNSEKSQFIKIVSRNKYIELFFFSSIPTADDKYLSIDKLIRYWNSNKAKPLSQTVLNTALSIAIAMYYKEIYLVGADTSWIKELEVDQSTNDLFTISRHYYGEKRYLISKYNDEKSNLSEELESNKKALDNYQLLKQYAQHNGCHLYNASKYSLIDCIDRKRL